MARVELRGLSKTFANGVEALAPFDGNVGDGEFLTVLGPSGSGKSTLLRLIAGLETPTTGLIFLGGRDVTRLPPGERGVSLVFQEPALYPHLSVRDNLAFGLRARGVDRAETATRVDEAANWLGIGDLLGRKPGTLSGGQKQRVALGRAIATRPVVLLLDEPFSRLDAPLRASIRAELIEIHRRLGTTIILVTHDQGEALGTGDRVAVVDRGRVLQVGTPGEVYERPASRAVAGFLGHPPMNFIAGEVRETSEGLRLRNDLGGPGGGFSLVGSEWEDGLRRRIGTKVVLGLRPEALTLDGGGPDWAEGEGRVVRREYLGWETVVTLGIGGLRLAARRFGRVTWEVGDVVRVGVDLAGAIWFDAESGEAIEIGNVRRVPDCRGAGEGIA